MQRLIEQLQRQLGKGWIEIVEWLRSTNSLTAIDARLAAGDYAGVVAEVESAALRFAAEGHTAYVTAGQKAAKWLDAKVPDALVRFDQTNTRAVRRAEQNQLELVRGFTQEQREVTRRVLVEGARTGVNPREMARDIRDSIGLTDTQSQHVLNYRRQLESRQFGAAMSRELHDARADRTLARLRRAGDSLTPAQVDKMVEAYRKNYISYRAETIARTEALKHAHEGAAEGMQQAVERGDIEAGSLTKTWNAGPRTRHARVDHQHMDGKRVPFGQLFELPDGTRMTGPGDPAGGATHNANCRCNSSTQYEPDADASRRDPRREPSNDAPAAPRTVAAPPGFAQPQNTEIVRGIPDRDQIDDEALYRVSIAELRRRLIALPGGGTDAQRMRGIRDAMNGTGNLPPVELLMLPNGDLFVNDGRHRLLVAIEGNRDVLVRFDRGVAGTEVGTVPLVKLLR